MPTYKYRKARASEQDKRRADDVLKKYVEHIPGHYTELIQGDLVKRGLKYKYTDAQVRDFFQRRNYHADICTSVENVGRQYYITPLTNQQSS